MVFFIYDSYYNPNLTIIPQTKKPDPKNTEPQNPPNTAMKSPGEPYTRFILDHHTQNGTTVLDSRFQHSTG
ncbi:MAG: hypothetical protein HOK59_07305 [Candidatus Marinimicrobia bacterium]|nr:hypothetical protein [Candidatus Neomarinimicrobiota bacterium]